MQVHVPLGLSIIWMIVVLAAQSGTDYYYTREVLLQPPKKKTLLLVVCGGTGMVLMVLLINLLHPVMFRLLISARNEGQYFALWIMGLVGFYVLLGALFTLIKGSLIQVFALDGQSPERKQSWWSYTFVGNVVTLLFSAPVFFISILVPALVETLPLN